MASFDVTSLFTNILVDETFEIISNQIFANCVVFEGLDRSQFFKFLTLAVKNCHFTFNNRIYQQIDGVAMGSSPGPLFANILMSFHEKTWLHNCPSLFKPLLYRRYVDDCFLFFKSLNHVPLFLDYLNCANILTSLLHPNWKKTVSFLFSMLKYFAQAVNFPPLFIVNPLLLVFSRISTALFHLPT